MRIFNVFSVIALILTIVGALNWLSIGIFGFNVVTWVSFGMGWVERLLYVLVGLSGVFMIIWLCLSKARMADNAIA